MAACRTSRFSILVVLAILCIILFRGFPSLHDPGPPPQLEYSSGRQKIHFRKSSFDWATAKEYFPIESPLTPLPPGKPKTLPTVQHKFTSKKNDRITEKRRAAVLKAFIRSWTAYKRHAWLLDEVGPVSGGGRNTFGGWAATLVDGLDSLWIMGLHDDFYIAAEAAAQLDWANTTETSANLFETTIRHLGGLLSAYDLSGEHALLEKAKELGDMLYMAFDTPNRIPGFWMNFEDARNGGQVAGTHDPSACPTSLSLEFTRLAQLTGQDKYYDAIDRVRAFLERTQDQSMLPGMWPRELNFRAEEVFSDTTFTLGALADSLYEYLPKNFIITGGLEASYEKMYRKAMDVITKHLLFRPMLPDNQDILFAGTTYIHDGRPDLDPEGQHLSCFAGGMYLLGGKTFGIEEHLKIGERLTRGCVWAYNAFPTGLMPEIFSMIPCASQSGCEWDADRWATEGNQKLAKGLRDARDPRYILRPEAIESVFLLYRITGKEELRDIAWTMFESIIKATETGLAYSAIQDVTVTGETEKVNSMEVSTVKFFSLHSTEMHPRFRRIFSLFLSVLPKYNFHHSLIGRLVFFSRFVFLTHKRQQSFWMAETLKYFYLIFSPPDVISLDDYVFNTEAHPLRRPR